MSPPVSSRHFRMVMPVQVFDELDITGSRQVVMKLYMYGTSCYYFSQLY